MPTYPLEWDKQSQRLYETGVDRGVLYVMGDDGNYGAGVVWNGLTAVNEKPDGAEPNELYADNIKYATLRSAETFGATIEAYMFPEEFYECDGSKEVATGVYVGQQARKSFGFCYRTLVGNDSESYETFGYKLHLIYNATASPSEKNFETVNDNPDAISMSWDIDTNPIPVPGGKPTSTIVIDSTKCDAAKLTSFESILYGTAGGAGVDPVPARLPLPDEVISHFA